MKTADEKDKKFRECLAHFHRFAVEGETMNTIDSIQLELRDWQYRNFGPSIDMKFSSGVCEEVGELYEAREERHPNKILDAYGDVIVFLCQLLTNNKLALYPIIKSRRGDGRTNIAIPAGRLSKAVLKRSQLIRGMGGDDAYRTEIVEQASNVISTMRAQVEMELHCLRLPPCPEPAYVFIDIATQVMKRDWLSEPIDGNLVT